MRTMLLDLARTVALAARWGVPAGLVSALIAWPLAGWSWSALAVGVAAGTAAVWVLTRQLAVAIEQAAAERDACPCRDAALDAIVLSHAAACARGRVTVH